MVTIRINHHILTTNSFLFKIGKNDTNLCNLCKIEEETIYHLLWQCPIVQDLINNFFNFCNTRGIMVPRDPCTFIFGVDLHPNCKNLFSIFLVLKAYIYSFQGLLRDIKTHITTLKYIATKNGRLGYFNKEWGTWLFICRLWQFTKFTEF